VKRDAIGARETFVSPKRQGSSVPDAYGTYALLLRCVCVGTVGVGSLGVMPIEPGSYLYLGSAFGPGGLRARLTRHAVRRKVERWHIDYLRPRVSLAGAWFSTQPDHLEHDWAARVLALLGSGARSATSEPRQGPNGPGRPSSRTIPLRRFGASDCRCPSHLVHFPDTPSSRRSIAKVLADSAPTYVEAEVLRGLARRRR
jgi:Uri superfamily endonuclease